MENTRGGVLRILLQRGNIPAFILWVVELMLSREPRRTLGGATHFASLCEALVEQSAAVVLQAILQIRPALIITDLRSAKLKNKREITARAISLLLVEKDLGELNLLIDSY